MFHLFTYTTKNLRMKKIFFYIRCMNKGTKIGLSFFLFLLFHIISSSVYSQASENLLHKKNEKVLNEKLSFLNSALAKGEISIEKKRFTIKFSENGEVYRTDFMYIETLDPEGIYYSAEENAVIVKCKSEEKLTPKQKKFKDGCIERHIHKNNIIRAYKRINFELKGANFNEFIEVFTEIVEAAQDVSEE